MPDRRTYTTIDAHAGGEPLRLLTSEAPVLSAPTMAARRFELLEHHDHIRRALLFEPRGHSDMYGAIFSDPVSPGADYGVNFLTNEGYSTMCGHGIIALTTILVETGRHPTDGNSARIVYDTPAGVVTATAEIADGRVMRVAFENVPAARIAKDLEITLESGRTIDVDVVWGGAFYALVTASALDVEIGPENVGALIRAGMDVKRATMRAMSVIHPFDPDLNGLYGTILTGPPSSGAADGRNIVIFADGEVDRSPCGTGTSARLAALVRRWRDRGRRAYRHESVTGSIFTGQVLGETTSAISWP